MAQESQSFAAFSEPTAFAKSMASSQEARSFFKNHPQSMTLDALLQAGLPIYVKNNVSRPGRIALEFNVTGRRVSLNIPNTWIAIRLNDHMSAQDISTSGQLRDMLRKRILILVHPDKAEAEYETERGQRELANVRSSLAKAEGSDYAVKTVLASEVSDRMKALVIEYLDAKDENERTIVGDTIFNSARVFSETDVNYFASKASGTPAGQKLATELHDFIASRS